MATKRQTVRCSALPRILSCPASARTPRVLVDQDSEAARLGTAVHERLYRQCVKGTHSPDAFEPKLVIQNRYRLSDEAMDEYIWLVTRGREIWEQVGGAFDADSLCGELTMERDYAGEGIRLSGHADVVGTVNKGQMLIVLDWKTGRLDHVYRNQLVGYMALARHIFKRATSFKIVTAWVRYGNYDTTEISLDEIMDLEAALDLLPSKSRREYNPTPENCQWCPRWQTCAARRDYIKNAVATFGDAQGAGLDTPQKLAELWPMVSMLSKSIDQYKDAVKTAIKTHGPLTLKIGDELRIKEQDQQKIELTTASAEILQQAGVDLYGLSLTLSKTPVLAAVAKAAGRGNGKNAKEAVLEKLDAAGAIRHSTVEKLEVVRKGTDNGQE